METQKTCCACKEPLDRSDFYRDRSQDDGLARPCKECSRLAQKKYRAKVREGKERVAEEPRRVSGRSFIRCECPNCGTKLEVV